MSSLLPGLLALSMATAALSQPGTPAASAAEARLKLAYLYNFAQFVDWPSQRLPAGTPLRLCVLGEHPFGDELGALGKRQVRGHPLAVERLSALAAVDSCHLIYVERLGGAQQLQALRASGALVVSSHAGALREGATIEFVRDGDRLRWRLNLEQARQNGLGVSAKLVELSLPPP